MLDVPMALATEAKIVDRLKPPMDRYSVFLMGSQMAARTEIMMVCVMEHRTAHLTGFHLILYRSNT